MLLWNLRSPPKWKSHQVQRTGSERGRARSNAGAGRVGTPARPEGQGAPGTPQPSEQPARRRVKTFRGMRGLGQSTCHTYLSSGSSWKMRPTRSKDDAREEDGETGNRKQEVDPTGGSEARPARAHATHAQQGRPSGRGLQALQARDLVVRGNVESRKTQVQDNGKLSKWKKSHNY